MEEEMLLLTLLDDNSVEETVAPANKRLEGEWHEVLVNIGADDSVTIMISAESLAVLRGRVAAYRDE